ncbi:MAG: hypothetical protein GX587_08035, partial [Bacteroidales bacterium]|nr:hypothetical protein [Bacteroidales bacterium]
YNIEHILGLNTLISERNDILDSTDCGYKIYEFGVILKKEKGVVQYKSLDYADMVKIQSLYKEWWNNNKNKSLETLQIEWQNGIKPIPDESEYIWK